MGDAGQRGVQAREPALQTPLLKLLQTMCFFLLSVYMHESVGLQGVLPALQTPAEKMVHSTYFFFLAEKTHFPEDFIGRNSIAPGRVDPKNHTLYTRVLSHPAQDLDEFPGPNRVVSESSTARSCDNRSGADNKGDS